MVWCSPRLTLWSLISTGLFGLARLDPMGLPRRDLLPTPLGLRHRPPELGPDLPQES
jgi:hypothetical protein